MEINDEFIKDYIINYKKNTGKRPIFKYYDKEVKDYILNRYSDSLSYQESIYRIFNNIEIRPTCKYCGNIIKFKGRGKGQAYNKYCSHYCEGKDISQFKQTNKIKSIIFNKYGVDNVFKLKETRDKSKQTKLKLYGDENYNNSEKAKQTCLDKYGVCYLAQNKIIREKQIKTSFERYGGYWNKEKVSETMMNRYGVEWYTLSDDLKNKANSEEAKLKQYKTKKENNSFNVSKPEDECYELLKEKYPDIIRQYRDERYPFNCDFYIPSLDLFIEYQGSHYHQGHPFNKNNIDDIKILEDLKEKANKSIRHKEGKKSQYDIIINTWTIRDIGKRNIAKQNDLNYLEFWNIDDVKLWLQQN